MSTPPTPPTPLFSSPRSGGSGRDCEGVTSSPSFPTKSAKKNPIQNFETEKGTGDPAEKNAGENPGLKFTRSLWKKIHRKNREVVRGVTLEKNSEANFREAVSHDFFRKALKDLMGITEESEFAYATAERQWEVLNVSEDLRRAAIRAIRALRATMPKEVPGEKNSTAARLIFWSVVRVFMRWRYGVRGAIRPPINWGRVNSRWYRWRRWCWAIDERLYQGSGLSDQWWESVRGQELKPLDGTRMWVGPVTNLP